VSRTKITILIVFFASLICQDISAEEKSLHWPDASLIKDCERRIDLINKSIGSKNGYSEDHTYTDSLIWHIENLDYPPHVNCFLDSNLRMKRNELINKTAKYYSEDNSKWIFLESLFGLMKKITSDGIDGAEIIKSLSASGNEYASFSLAEFYRDGDGLPPKKWSSLMYGL